MLFPLFFISLILMFITLHRRFDHKRLFYRQGLEFTDQYRLKLNEALRQNKPQDEIEIILGYAFGDYRFMTKELKEIHNKFNLNHLFTPSAFHFSCLINFLKPLLSSFPFLETAVVIILSLFFLVWSPFAECFALQRICYLKIISEFLVKANKVVPQSILFFAIFFLDLIFGSFYKSPLSFVYSFLFYGTVLLLSKNKWYELLLGIFLGQWFLTSLSHKSFFPINTILGFALTAIIGIFLPLIMASFFCKINFLLTLSLKLTSIEIWLLKAVATLPTSVEIYFPTISLILIFVILILWADYFSIRKKLAKGIHHIFYLGQQYFLKSRTISDITIL